MKKREREGERLMGEVKVKLHRLCFKFACIKHLPGSGHPLNSALGTESVQKGQKGKESLAKQERSGGGRKETVYRTEKSS